MTATRKHEELEVVGRYYSTDYVNPFARPISQPDEFEGQRARDEAGNERQQHRNTGKRGNVGLFHWGALLRQGHDIKTISFCPRRTNERTATAKSMT